VKERVVERERGFIGDIFKGGCKLPSDKKKIREPPVSR
jgi:hypothetical protein